MIQILQVLGEEVPVIKSVISRLLCAVLITADCIRGFSVMKLLKTALRNRISQQHLNAAMLVKIEGPDDHAFDFEQAKAIFCRNKTLLTLSKSVGPPPFPLSVLIPLALSANYTMVVKTVFLVKNNSNSSASL